MNSLSTEKVTLLFSYPGGKQTIAYKLEIKVHAATWDKLELKFKDDNWIYSEQFDFAGILEWFNI